MVAFDTTDFEALGGLVIVLEPTGAIVFWNTATTQLIGRSADEARGQHIGRYLSSASSEGIDDALREIAATRRPGRFEGAVVSRTGAPRRILFSTSVFDGPGGGPSLVLLNGLDVTEPLAAREADLARLRALLAQAPDGIFVADLDGRYTDVNDAGCRLLGYSREEILQKSITDLLPPGDISRLWETRERLLEGRVVVSDWRLRRKDGSFVPVEVSAKILPDGRWQGLVRDITERLRLEGSLRESLADLGRAQAVAKVGSWRLDLRRDELLWSDETHRIFGTRPGTPMTYEAFLSHVHPDDRAFVEEKWRAALRGEPYDIEHRIVVGDQIKWVRERADFEFDDTGVLRRGIGVVLDITEEKEATEELRLWRDRLNAIISTAADAIISVDDEQRIVLYNEGAEQIFGWSQAEVLGQPLELLIPARLRALHAEHMKRFSEEPVGSRRMGERSAAIFGLRKNGDEFPAEAAISKVEVAGRRLFTVTLRDISERVAHEQERERLLHAVRLSEERLRVSLRASPTVVFNQDSQLRYTWIHNPRQPFAAEQVLGKTDFDLLPPADAEELTRHKRQVLETGAGKHTVVRATIGPDVYYYDLTLEPLRDASGRIVGITCATWDITEQRRAEDAQRFLAEAGSVLLSATLDLEEILARVGRLAVRELADWFLVDVIEAGQVRRLRVAHSDPSRSELAQRLRTLQLDRGRPHLMFDPLQHRRMRIESHVDDDDLETLAQTPEHRQVLRSLNIRSFIAAPLVSRGQLLGAFALISSRETHRYGERDARLATDFARIAALAVENARLYESAQRALATRDEVLGIVAHDLRNPLNIVILQSHLLRRRGVAREDPGRGPVDAIARAAQRMNRLVQDMLDVARLESGPLGIERRAVATRELIGEAFQSHREMVSRAGLELRSSAPGRLPDVLGDRDRLLQVLDNLIGNAVKFTPSGGRIVMGAEARERDVLFWVEDTGPGIPAEQIPHLFDPFWQATKTDRRGAGLGLPIVKGIVEAHGGRVWVDSRVGQGSVFYFTVPVADQPRAAANAHAASPH